MSLELVITRATVEVKHVAGSGDRSSLVYRLHQSVADLFGDRTDRGYLFRVMREGQERHVLLVLSDRPPLACGEARAWPGRRTLAVEHKPYAPDLPAGRLLDFEIRLNATQVITSSEGRKQREDVWNAVWERDHETPLTPHQVYGAYLVRKLRDAADVLDARVTARGEQRVLRPGGGTVIPFVVADVRGTLRVTDGDRLRAIIAEGIGRSKALGCGLLCLSRPGSMLPRRDHAVPADAPAG